MKIDESVLSADIPSLPLMTKLTMWYKIHLVSNTQQYHSAIRSETNTVKCLFSWTGEGMEAPFSKFCGHYLMNGAGVVAVDLPSKWPGLARWVEL